jgi:putative transposase
LVAFQADGRKFRALSVVDDCSRECPAIAVDRSLPGDRVVRELEQIAQTRGYPDVIVCDNGPELRGTALDQWAYAHAARLQFIEPGKPVRNCFIESLNGRLRDECLNENWFVSLADAQRTIEAFRVDYNNTRPHSGVAGCTPQEFVTAYHQKHALHFATITD